MRKITEGTREKCRRDMGPHRLSVTLRREIDQIMEQSHLTVRQPVSHLRGRSGSSSSLRSPLSKELYADETPFGTLMMLEVVATMSGARLTANQWVQLSDAIADGQWREILSAYQWVQTKTPRVDSRFSRNGSRLSQAVERS